MSKKMTPCEKLGYKVGDRFKVVDGTGVNYAVGSFITLIRDDGSSCPRFNGVNAIYESGDSFFQLSFVEKVAKLKPAKQALADAIHQNGGWAEGGEFAAQDKAGEEGCAVWFYSGERPYKHSDFWYPSDNGEAIYGKHISCDTPFVNWHQTVFSRDEYFTAYTEQVMVDAENETEQEVEVEMKSESEVTIKVGDWHKNGGLPPVGEICIFSPPPCSEHYFPDFALKAKGKEVLIIAHTRFNRGVGDVAVMKWDFGDYGGVCSANQMCFIPLLTERDKAIDEMVGCLSSRWANCEEIAAHLYENGYRKGVK